jgi:hypothetical protein
MVHFATSEYAAAFLDVPQPDTQTIRSSAIDYLATFDAELWYNDPVRKGSCVLLYVV